jgi:uncharacterized membrane protein YphA (DoxX/SURF4 family)
MNWIVGPALTGSGLFLLAGFLTPLAGALVALTTLATGLAWVQPPQPDLFQGPLTTGLLTIVAIAIAFLGPGSFSLDRRIFGRREIIIPRMPHSSSES